MSGELPPGTRLFSSIGALHHSDPDISEYKRKRRQKFAALGRANAIERANQRLPHRYGLLSLGEIQRLKAAVEGIFQSEEDREEHINGAMAVCACLFTGRRLTEISQLKVHRSPVLEEDGSETVPYGLVNLDKAWGWCLAAGGPSSKQHKKSEDAQTLPISRSVWLPCTSLFMQLLDSENTRFRGGRLGQSPHCSLSGLKSLVSGEIGA